jgi:hypothetical protein
VRNRATQSAWLVAGAAAGAAAAWLGKRRLSVVSNPTDAELIEPESAELPIGRSADPEIDGALSRKLLPQDQTSGAALLTEPEPFLDESTTDASLDEVWSSLPGFAEGEQTEGYDAVRPEQLGSVWLERATQTTHEHRPHGSDPNEVPDVTELFVSEATLASSHFDEEESKEDEDEDEEIRDDELD